MSCNTCHGMNVRVCPDERHRHETYRPPLLAPNGARIAGQYGPEERLSLYWANVEMEQQLAQAKASPTIPAHGYHTQEKGGHVRIVLCPYCSSPTPLHPQGQLHTFELHPDFHPDIEALHCDFASLPFDILFHDDGTPEPIPQHDPRFQP